MQAFTAGLACRVGASMEVGFLTGEFGGREQQAGAAKAKA
jgi:hypothetical protein